MRYYGLTLSNLRMKHQTAERRPSGNIGPIKGALFLAIPLLAFAALLEFAAGRYLESRLPGFDLAVQGLGQMASSGYQLWEHPAGYRSWSGQTRFNNHGFRRTQDTTTVKAGGTIRVFFMGGSAALGSQANTKTPYYRMSGQGEYSNDETISAHLERLWSERFPGQRVEVINAATNWTQLHQQFIHYHRKLKSLQPDLVISMDGQNDALLLDEHRLNVWDAATIKAHLLESDFRIRARPLLTRSKALYLGAILMFGSGQSGRVKPDLELVNEYKDRAPRGDANALDASFYAANKRTVDRVVDEYAQNLLHFNDSLKRDGVRGLFLLQPELIMDKSKPLTDIERAIRNHMLLSDRGFEVNFFSQVEQKGQALRASDNLPFFSLLQAFDGITGEVYTDYCHMTPSGNELLAGKLLAIIEKKYPELFSASR